MNYTTIESEEQYDEYCRKWLELSAQKINFQLISEAEVIELLLRKWESKAKGLDSIQLLLALMENHSLALKDLEEITMLPSETLVKMINYEIDIPKETVTKLAERFKMREVAFMNRRIYK